MKMKKIYTNSLISLLAVFTIVHNNLIAKEIDESAEIVHVANFQYTPNTSQVVSRTLMDTLIHGYDGWGSYFSMVPGDMMITVYQAETDGNLKAVNVPVAHWGSSSDEVTISIHKTSYPFDTNGDEYHQTFINGAGWLGGYDDDNNGILELTGSNWIDGDGYYGNCNNADMIDNNQDPLGSFSASSGPTGTPLKGLLWPDGSTAATLNPMDHPDLNNGGGDNWVQLSDYGSEPTVSAGDYICVAVHYTGSGGDGSDPNIGFIFKEYDWNILGSPWASLKYYDSECSGTSGENGWHIRSRVFNFQLQIEYTSDRRPQFLGINSNGAARSNQDISVIARISDDNPEGGSAGVTSATVHYSLDGWATEMTLSMTLVDGSYLDGYWGADIPGSSSGDVVSYYFEALDVNNNSNSSSTRYTHMLDVNSNLLFINNSDNFGDTFNNESIVDMYLADVDVDVDYIDTKEIGNPGVGFLREYSIIVEITGHYPNFNLTQDTRQWYEDGGRRYIICGQDFLWNLEVGQGDHVYQEGSFEYDILGLTGSRQELYTNTNDHNRLIALEDNFISGDLYDLVESGDYFLNYAPRHELDHNNYIDGLVLGETAEPLINVYEGSFGWLEDDNPSSVIMPAGLYNQSYGSKVLFFAFNPLGVNAYNSNSNPDYIQVGQTENGVLQQSVEFMLPELSAELSDENAFIGDTVWVDLDVSMYNDSSYFAFEGTFSGFDEGMEFLGFDTVGTLMGDAGWYYTYNTNDDMSEIYFAATGDEDVVADGTLLTLVFLATDVMEDFHVNLSNAVFNADMLPQLGSGSITVFALNYGDVNFNDNVQAYDASLILQYLMNYIEFDWAQERLADVTLDATVSALDASVILQYIVELVDSLPYDDTSNALVATGNTWMEDMQVHIGQEYQLPVAIEEANNIYSIEGAIEFDPNAIQINDLVWNQSFGNFFIEEENTDGLIRFVVAGVNPVSGIDELFKVNLEILNGLSGETTMNLINLRLNESSIIDLASSSEISQSVLSADNEIPYQFTLHNNYPNPFNPETNIQFDIPESLPVKLAIYDLSGKEVNVLVQNTFAPGKYKVVWNGKDQYGQPVSAGMYIYQIEAGNFRNTKKLILLK